MRYSLKGTFLITWLALLSLLQASVSKDDEILDVEQAVTGIHINDLPDDVFLRILSMGDNGEGHKTQLNIPAIFVFKPHLDSLNLDQQSLNQGFNDRWTNIVTKSHLDTLRLVCKKWRHAAEKSLKVPSFFQIISKNSLEYLKRQPQVVRDNACASIHLMSQLVRDNACAGILLLSQPREDFVDLKLKNDNDFRDFMNIFKSLQLFGATNSIHRLIDLYNKNPEEKFIVTRNLGLDLTKANQGIILKMFPLLRELSLSTINPMTKVNFDGRHIACLKELEGLALGSLIVSDQLADDNLYNLKYISMRSCTVDSAFISKCKNLVLLNLQDSSLYNFSQGLSLKTLKVLTIYRFPSSVEVKETLKFLKYSPAISYLDLESSDLSTVNFEDMPVVQNLWIRDCTGLDHENVFKNAPREFNSIAICVNGLMGRNDPLSFQLSCSFIRGLPMICNNVKIGNNAVNCGVRDSLERDWSQSGDHAQFVDDEEYSCERP